MMLTESGIFKLSKLTRRVELGTLLYDRGLLDKAVEVGVHRGDFSEGFYQHWVGSKLYLVDPWQKLDQNEYNDIRNKEFDPATYDYVVNRFKRYGNKVELIREYSNLACLMFPSESLDFVYIDANHSEKHVKEDLELWYPKIKCGGVISGHDILFDEHLGVTNAVIAFAIKFHLEVNIIPQELEEGRLVSPCSYYMFKT